MEFWGVEVKSGKPLKVTLVDDMVLRLSQASIGERKKERRNESICMFVNIDGKKLVLGTLVTDKLPQQQFDLVFDRDFEISHSWKSGSVYFCGYMTSKPVDSELSEEGSDESESEEDIPLTTATIGKPKTKAKQEKPLEIQKVNIAKAKKSGAGNQMKKIMESNEEGEESSDGDSMSEDNEEDDSEDDGGSDESDQDELLPNKVGGPSKKRTPESAMRTPVQGKKAKLSPLKSEGKKVGGHVATPYPAKKPKPGLGTSNSCKTCNRTFGSEKALLSHKTAKHS